MNKDPELSETMHPMDLGDAMLETKQYSPIPPYHFDAVYGLGIRNI